MYTPVADPAVVNCHQETCKRSNFRSFAGSDSLSERLHHLSFFPLFGKFSLQLSLNGLKLHLTSLSVPVPIKSESVLRVLQNFSLFTNFLTRHSVYLCKISPLDLMLMGTHSTRFETLPLAVAGFASCTFRRASLHRC